jgi:uncharacterized HAD superfamily protein
MKIGLDFDEVISNTVSTVLEDYNKKTGNSYSKSELKIYKFWEIWHIPQKEAIKIFEDFYDFEDNGKIKPLDGAVDSINALSKNNELIIISSRHSRHAPVMSSWLKKHFPANNFPIHNSGEVHDAKKLSKAEICKKLQIPLILEDSPDTALNCAKNDIKVILFNQPWNQEIKHKNIQRVNNWEEAYPIVESLTHDSL